MHTMYSVAYTRRHFRIRPCHRGGMVVSWAKVMIQNRECRDSVTRINLCPVHYEATRVPLLFRFLRLRDRSCFSWLEAYS